MIKFNFFGDFVVENISEVSIAQNMKELLNEADYNVVNFEAPIKTLNAKKTLKSGPSLQQDINAPKWLKQHGFNVFTLANNHIMDFGASSAKRTVEVLGEENVVGIGQGEQAYHPMLLEKEGVTIALLSLVELQFGMLHDMWTQKNEYGCPWINHPKVNGVIKQLKEKVDFLVVVAHAGLEGVEIPLPEWRDRYRELIDEGADVVIGGHTHIAQGYEVYNGKPIFYSLGNFCFTKKQKMNESWYLGECVRLIFIDKKFFQFDVFGTSFVDEKRLSLIRDNVWVETLHGLNHVICPDTYMSEVNDVCRKALDSYNVLFSASGYIFLDRHIIKSIIRWLIRRCKDVHLINNMQCESHRWTILRALRLKNNLK